jgi:hypothetical protein
VTNELQLFSGDVILAGKVAEIMLREQIIPKLKNRRPLFYLDAHAPVSFPILGELDAIAECAHLEPIIVIHDFYNPHRPEMECEVDPKGRKLDWDYIYEKLVPIYGHHQVARYNYYATTHQIGVVFIGVKQW